MDAMTPITDRAVALPPANLAPLVRRYVGYRYEGFPSGTHTGLPTPYLTLIISLGTPVRLTAMPDPAQSPGEFVASVGGLHASPTTVAHDGTLAGMQIDLTPAGARSLLGVPAAELGPMVVGLEDLVGSDATELIDRVATAPDWRSRFAVLDSVMQRRAGLRSPAPPALTGAWNLILRHGGTLPVSSIAHEVGWSRRQLVERFTREYGLTVKGAARIVRFHRSRVLLQRRPEMAIGAIAAVSGYYDQAHMAREWRSLAGVPPSAWLAAEDLPFIQDEEGLEFGD